MMVRPVRRNHHAAAAVADDDDDGDGDDSEALMTIHHCDVMSSARRHWQLPPLLAVHGSRSTHSFRERRLQLCIVLHDRIYSTVGHSAEC